MQLSDADSVFGLSMPLVKKGSSKYRITFIMCVLLDLLLVIASSISLWYKGSPILVIELAFIVAIFINLLSMLLTNGDNREAYVIYLRCKRRKIQVKTYDIDAEKLYSVLFVSGYKKIKPNLTIDAYKEAFNSACIQNKRYSVRLLKNLAKYESESGNFSIIACGRYYIDYKEGK